MSFGKQGAIHDGFKAAFVNRTFILEAAPASPRL